MAGEPAVLIWHWLAFGLFVVVLLVLDLFIFHRDSRDPTLRESTVWTLIWCAVALAFNGLVWIWRGPEIGIQFLTGYLVEWSLSMDNVFVFAVIFNYFGVPLKYQYRVLFWGIIGAVVMRLTFILLGVALLQQFSWILWIFGAFLIYTGIKLALHGDSDFNPENDLTMRAAKRVFRIAKENHRERFFVVENGLHCITPLFLVLLVVDSADLIFAVDSVPAIFGVTQDPFTVFTSDVCAILGLRALYFLLAGVMDLFHYLNYGLCAVLIFVGVKMVAEFWLDDHLVHPGGSLAIILLLLGISILASIFAKRPPPVAGEKSG
ncbi:MAG: TerC family protein [Planctomycetia bacterium]|nr:TerC family protein [Planctomycetia bacterium]